MNVLFLVRTLAFGGAERQLVALARGLHERGHQVRIMVFYPGGPLEPEARAAGIPIVSVDKRGRWDLLGFFWRMAKEMRRARPDVVHGYLAASNVLSLLFKPLHGGRSVWGVRASGMDLSRYDWLMRLDCWVERQLSRFAARIIANSYAGKAYAVSRGFPESKTVVIPNGIDTGRFAPDPAARAAVRAELGVAADQVLIGRIGRLAPQKDYPTFLGAAALIAMRRPAARFVCVGTGAGAAATELTALAGQLGIADKVIWAGARADMPAVYNALDLCVSSSAFGEGTPNPVAEAMACGVPCVVTDVGDSAATVGDLGRVVSKENPAELAVAALATLDDLAAGRIDRAALRAHVVDGLSLESLIERTEAELLALLPKAGQTAGLEVREARV